MKRFPLIALLTLSAALSTAISSADDTKKTPGAKAAAKFPTPTHAKVSYGPHQKQFFHFWQAPSEKPTPLLVYIHGGGWRGGNLNSGTTAFIPELLDQGISVASVEYRFVQEAGDITPPVKAPLHDAARAIQTLRSRAEEWNLDKTRVVASGGSAGACTSLWLAFHDDLADPDSDDPIARESTRLTAAAVWGAQTTLDPQQMIEWTPNSKYGNHAFGILPKPGSKQTQFEAFLAARNDILPWIAEYSPYALVTSDDPPVYLSYKAKPALGQEQKDPTHTANFGLKLKEKLEAKGVPCELVYPGSTKPNFTDQNAFIIAKLKE